MRELLSVLTVGAEYSKLFLVVEHCYLMGKATGSIRSRSLKMLVEGNRIKNADHIGVTRIGPHRSPSRRTRKYSGHDIYTVMLFNQSTVPTDL